MSHSDEYRYGLTIRGAFVTWDGIERRYVCRHCHARIGKPYADPVTGRLDFNRKVCGGEMEHDIRNEGDVIASAQIDWQEEQNFWDGFEVRGVYAERRAVSSGLFEDPGFAGFGD